MVNACILNISDKHLHYFTYSTLILLSRSFVNALIFFLANRYVTDISHAVINLWFSEHINHFLS